MVGNKVADNQLYSKLLTEFEIYENLFDGDKNGKTFSQRKDAISVFENSGFPTIKHEEWKYTPVNFINKNEFHFIKEADFSSINNDLIQKLLIPSCANNFILLVNGNFSPTFSKIANSNIKIKEISNLNTNGTEDLLAKFNALLDYSKNPFLAINTALSTNSLLIEVDGNVEVEETLQIINIIDSSNEALMVNSQIYISLGTSSSLDIVETIHHIGYNEAINNSTTSALISPNAQLLHTLVQHQNSNLYDFHSLNFELNRDSKLFQSNLSLSGKFIRNDVYTKFAQDNGHAEYLGLFLPKEDSLIDNHTTFDHAMPDCTSNEIYKGVIFDKAKGVFNGKIKVRRDAQKTDAYQSSKSIIMSDNANVYSKPELEIFADDVKCSHGSSTGTIEPEHLYYLQTRGISKDTAQAMLLNAYVNDVVEKLKSPKVKEHIANIVVEMFPIE